MDFLKYVPFYDLRNPIFIRRFLHNLNCDEVNIQNMLSMLFRQNVVLTPDLLEKVLVESNFSPKIARFLMTNKVDINLENEYGLTPLRFCVRHAALPPDINTSNVIKVVEVFSNYSTLNENYMAAIDDAIKYRELQILRILLSRLEPKTASQFVSLKIPCYPNDKPLLTMLQQFQ